MLWWIKRILWGAVGLVFLVLLLGLGHEQWSRWSAARQFPPPGRLVEVDGRLSHIECGGEGSPTVILEAGLDAGGSRSWSNIFPDLTQITRVCVYDRAGIMWSESRPEPRDAVHAVRELHALLEAASERPPYVMVGHSLGGPLIRVFTERFPDDVAGLVFVDSSHHEQRKRLPPEMRAATRSNPLLTRVLATIGFLRLTSGPRSKALPQQASAAMQALFPQSIGGVLQEVAAAQDIIEQSGANKTLGDRPIVVLTAAAPMNPLPDGITREIADRMQRIWREELQVEIAALSSNSDHRIFPKASHYIHWADPEAVVTAIRDVVTAVREGSRVPASVPGS